MGEIIEDIIKRLQEVFDPQMLGERIAEIFADVIVAILTFAAFYLAWIIIRFVMKAVMRSTKLDETSQEFIKTVVKYTILLAGLVNALSVMGIDTTGFLASLGIVGITVGFAAKDAFSNLISGILIYLDRPFVIGDLVEVGDCYGRVDQITLRSTRIITSDGKMLAVPNTEIINQIVTSYTNFPNLRLDIAVTIGVMEDIGKAREVLLDVLRNDADYMENPPARVVVTQLNDYNVALELQAWIKNERQHVDKKSELREKVFRALNEAEIEMPFETIQLTPLKVKLEEN
jgi:small conductance mechanosensitive channel